MIIVFIGNDGSRKTPTTKDLVKNFFKKKLGFKAVYYPNT